MNTTVELRTNMTRSGMVYIPKEVRESFGQALRIIPDARAAVVFPDGTDYDDVLCSLRIIITDIKHRIHLAEKARVNGQNNRRSQQYRSHSDISSTRPERQERKVG